MRAVTNDSASDFSFMWSEVTSHSLRHSSGNVACHFCTSGHNASNICVLVGAVMTHFIGARVFINHTTAHAANAVLPVPWPLADRQPRMASCQRPQRLGLPWIGLGAQHLTDEGDRRTVIARHARDERVVRLGDGLRPVERGGLFEVRRRIGDEVQHHVSVGLLRVSMDAFTSAR